MVAAVRLSTDRLDDLGEARRAGDELANDYLLSEVMQAYIRLMAVANLIEPL